MTQIEPTDEDIAEARSLAKITIATASHAEIRALAERPGDAKHLTLSILAHAQTLAKLRVAREALEDIADPIQAMQRYAESQGAKLSGMAYQIANDPEQLKRTARQALAHITQETHMVDGGPIR